MDSHGAGTLLYLDPSDSTEAIFSAIADLNNPMKKIWTAIGRVTRRGLHVIKDGCFEVLEAPQFLLVCKTSTSAHKSRMPGSSFNGPQ